jgi:hypothetical protein
LEDSERSEQLKIIAQDAILKKLGDMAGLQLNLVSLHGEVCPSPSAPLSLGDNYQTQYALTVKVMECDDSKAVQENLQAELFTLFDKLDTRSDGMLTRSEFISFMNALDVNLSRKYSIKVRETPYIGIQTVFYSWCLYRSCS